MNIEQLAEKMWHSIYPDRRKWQDLEQGTRDEWVRFAGISQEIILDDYLELSKNLDEFQSVIEIY